MNDNQKAFLRELSLLFNKYEIDEMLIFNDRIAMSSNSDVLAFRAYIRKKEKNLSYYTDIYTTESQFITEGGE